MRQSFQCTWKHFSHWHSVPLTLVLVGLLGVFGCGETPGGNSGSSGDQRVSSRDGPGSPQEAAPVGKPEILLTTRKQNTLVVAVDFLPLRQKLARMPVEQRRTFLLEECYRVMGEEDVLRDKSADKLCVYALFVPNRNEYAQGNFRDLEEIAIFHAEREAFADGTRPWEQRVANAEWKAAAQ
jgi:hypothetical protein